MIIYTVSSFVMCKTAGFQVNSEENGSKPSFGSDASISDSWIYLKITVV
jgi:hypothetical protein